MLPKLTPEECIKLIRRVIEGREKVARVCREAGISRTLFYRWLKRYREAPKPVIRELSPKERLAMIERVAAGEPVAKVCREFGISRVLFYKWKKRYDEAPEGQKLEALWDKKPVRGKYFRQAPEKVEQTVLSVVIQYPELSTHKIVEFLPQIGGKPILGNHGVQNVLRRHNLTTYQQRLNFSLARRHVPGIYDRFLHSFQTVLGSIVALPARRKLLTVRFSAGFLLGVFAGIVIFGAQGYLQMIAQAPVENKVGLIFASIALSAGSFFFLYSLKYYLTLALVLGFSRHVGETGGNGGNGKGYVGGLQPNLDHIKLSRHPFVSIHLPLYNERKVVDRLLTACTSMDYEAYEVIVVDDSTDETTKILEDWKNHPRVKIIHRDSRAGFKGGALRLALSICDPRAEFVLVFDADFIPYPDTITQFLKYFQSVAGTLTFINPKSEILNSKQIQNSNDQNSKQFSASDLDISASRSNIAAVQGYQWHVLNKSENWITRGVRSEYAGSYVVERSGTEVLGALKQIAGSVYMIRADLLRKYGWGTSITEDFQLTLRLYEQGYKVVYTPYVQGPAECVSTIKRLIRQRMRWSEGHSHNIRKMFWRLLVGSFERSDLRGGPTSPEKVWVPSPLTLTEKLEFLYLSPYYLQATLFLIGTLSWLISETVFRARLPFWTSLWGWSLVLTNLFSLPLMNTVGLFLEESEERDYLGILSFIALSYLLVPFQAYASIKGFLEKQEGPWFRTPKTGLITDIFTRGRFYRWISGILPGRAPVPATAQAQITNYQLPITNFYLSLATANNRFSNFTIRPRRLRWVSKIALAILLILSVSLYHLSFNVSQTYAAMSSSTQYLSLTNSSLISPAGTADQLEESQPGTDCTVGTDCPGIAKNTVANYRYKPGVTANATGETIGAPSGAGWIIEGDAAGVAIAAGTWTFKACIDADDTDGDSAGYGRAIAWKVETSGGAITSNYTQIVDTTTSGSGQDWWVDGYYTITGSGTATTFDAVQNHLYVQIWNIKTVKGDVGDLSTMRITGDEFATCGSGNNTIVISPTVTVPEFVLAFIFLIPFVPFLARKFQFKLVTRSAK